jgi:hypothetical protein
MKQVVHAASVVLALWVAVGCAPKPAETGAPSSPAPAPLPMPKAEAPEAAKEAPKQLKAQPLTEKSIRACLAAAKDPKLEEITAKYRTAGQGGLAGVQAGLATYTAPAEVQAVVKKHGFADWEEWAGTTSKLWVGAYKVSVAKAERELKNVPPEAAKMATAAQEQMKKGVEDAEKSVGTLSADELKAVEKLLPEIEKTTGKPGG